MGKMGLNAKEVLENVEKFIDGCGSYRIRLICEELSIFDWWPDKLSQTRLKDMRKFLKEAIKLGFNGYVCFKVGATGCANGMWAHVAESTDGYSPDGPFLYKSFTPEYNCWEIEMEDGERLTKVLGVPWDSLKTIKDLETAYSKVKETVKDLV